MNILKACEAVLTTKHYSAQSLSSGHVKKHMFRPWLCSWHTLNTRIFGCKKECNYIGIFLQIILGWPSALSCCLSCNFYYLNFHPLNSPGQFLTHSSKHELFLGTNLVIDTTFQMFLAASCAPLLTTSCCTHGCGASLPDITKIISICYVVKTQQAKSWTMFVGSFITHMPQETNWASQIWDHQILFLQIHN